jgi:hypothetical protein
VTELNEAQRRHLRVFLDQTEAAVSEVVALAEGSPENRLLRTDVADLPADFGHRIQPEIDSIRRSIGTLAERFGLEPDRQSRFRRAQAVLVTAAVEIEDATSRALRAYGPVDAAVSRELDPLLEDIGRALRAMIAALLASAAHPDQGCNSADSS